MVGTLPRGHPSLCSGENQVSPKGANVLTIAASSNTSLACSIKLVSVLFPPPNCTFCISFCTHLLFFIVDLHKSPVWFERKCPPEGVALLGAVFVGLVMAYLEEVCYCGSGL